MLASLLLTFLFLGFFSKPLLFADESIHQPVSTDIVKKLHHSQDVFNVVPETDRPLVLYAYAHSENAMINLKFFVERALHARADFIFIFNGESDAASLVPTHLENVRVITRPNACFDLGAFGDVLAQDNLWLRYKRFITLNASIRGPFLPMWSDDCWTDAFLNRITDKVKLVGLTYSCTPSPHTQSMLLATDQEGMRVLMDPNLAFSVPLDTPPWGGAELPTGFSVCYTEYSHAVHAEIGLTRLIRSQGYEVDVMLTSVHSANVADYCNPDRAGDADDHLKSGGYFGSNVHPYEIMFAKANRGIDDNLLTLFTAWHYQMKNQTSWDKCSRKHA